MDRSIAVGPLIKADRGLSGINPSVQQRHSVWDYHTCGSGINPGTDMGTRDKGAPKVQCRKGGGVYWPSASQDFAPMSPRGLLTFADQQFGKVGSKVQRRLRLLNHTSFFFYVTREFFLCFPTSD